MSYSLTTEDQAGVDRVVNFVMERYKNEGGNKHHLRLLERIIQVADTKED